MGGDLNPATTESPYEELALKGGALKYKTRSTEQYLDTRTPGTRHIARSFEELGLAEESVGD